MKKIMAMLVAVTMCGCLQIQRGDFKLKAVGSDVNTKEFIYTKTIGNGTNEYWHIKGSSVDQSASVHWICNTALSIAGGFGGFAVGNVPGAVAGASAGGGISELLQKWMDKGKKLIGSNTKKEAGAK
jgi:hypothetical protein